MKTFRIKKSICQYVGINSLLLIGYLMNGIVVGFDQTSIYIDELKLILILLILMFNLIINNIKIKIEK